MLSNCTCLMRVQAGYYTHNCVSLVLVTHKCCLPHSSGPTQCWRLCRDDTNGFQLYQSDPSGNYGGWKATAIGANHQGAQNILKQDYKDEITLEEATKLIIKVGYGCCLRFVGTCKSSKAKGLLSIPRGQRAACLHTAIPPRKSFSWSCELRPKS